MAHILLGALPDNMDAEYVALTYEQVAWSEGDPQDSCLRYGEHIGFVGIAQELLKYYASTWVGEFINWVLIEEPTTEECLVLLANPSFVGSALVF